MFHAVHICPVVFGIFWLSTYVRVLFLCFNVTHVSLICITCKYRTIPSGWLRILRQTQRKANINSKNRHSILTNKKEIITLIVIFCKLVCRGLRMYVHCTLTTRVTAVIYQQLYVTLLRQYSLSPAIHVAMKT
jgi:hypothetical protein